MKVIINTYLTPILHKIVVASSFNIKFELCFNFVCQFIRQHYYGERMNRLHKTTLKIRRFNFENGNFELFEEVLNSFGRSGDDMI